MSSSHQSLTANHSSLITHHLAADPERPYVSARATGSRGGWAGSPDAGSNAQPHTPATTSTMPMALNMGEKMKPESTMKTPVATTIGQYDGRGMWISCGISSGVGIQGRGVEAGRPDASRGYFSAQKASRLTTGGITAKLYSGGGDVVAPPSEGAAQGSLPATSPRVRLCTKFPMKIKIEAEMMNEPIVDTSFSVVTPRLG